MADLRNRFWKINLGIETTRILKERARSEFGKKYQNAYRLCQKNVHIEKCVWDCNSNFAWIKAA